MSPRAGPLPGRSCSASRRAARLDRTGPARTAGRFTAAHEAFWAAARGRHGDAAGTRALIEVLLLHRRLPDAAVLAGIRAALAVGSVSADVVATEARKHTVTTGAGPSATSQTAKGTGTAAGTASVPAPRRSRAALATLGALFQVFTEREERGSIAVASNSAFSEWAPKTQASIRTRDRTPT